MLKVDDYGRIRRALLDTSSERAVAKLLGHSRNTVRKARERAEPTGYRLSQPRARPRLDPVHELIEAMLATDEQAPRKQRHTAMQVYRRLRDEHGYAGSYSTVRRCVAELREAPRDTLVPLDHLPGWRLECDFGHIQVDLPEGRQQVSVLVCDWSYSNAPFAMALPTERTEAVLAGMVAAFEFFGCVPREVWWDNPKTIATAIFAGRERRFHDRWLALASAYCFEPRACLPGRGQEKPVAENRVKDLQRRWATPVPKADSLAAFNEHLRGLCLADRTRTVRGHAASIGEEFAQEQAVALALPLWPFQPVVYQAAKVDKYQQVRYDNAFYSVPPRVAFQTVTVQAGIDQVQVVWRGEVVACHERVYAAEQQVLDPLHYLPGLHRRPATLDHARVFRDWQLPAVFGQLRTALEQRHGAHAGRRHYVTVLRLLVEHPPECVAAVLRRHLARGLLDAGAIRLEVERGRLLDTTHHPMPMVDVPRPDLRQFDRLLSQGEPSHV